MPLSLSTNLSASATVVDVAEVPPSRIFNSAAVADKPKVTSCAAAFASSSNAFPAEVKSYVAAEPEPVN